MSKTRDKKHPRTQENISSSLSMSVLFQPGADFYCSHRALRIQAAEGNADTSSQVALTDKKQRGE